LTPGAEPLVPDMNAIEPATSPSMAAPVAPPYEPMPANGVQQSLTPAREPWRAPAPEPLGRAPWDPPQPEAPLLVDQEPALPAAEVAPEPTSLPAAAEAVPTLEPAPIAPPDAAFPTLETEPIGPSAAAPAVLPVAPPVPAALAPALAPDMAPASAGVPLAPAVAAPAVPDAEPGEPPLILLIEDDERIAKFYTILFQAKGFRVENARDGVEGVDMAQALKPALILLDVMMPKMNGLMVLQTLRANSDTENTPVVVLSNYMEPPLIQRALQLGAIEYVVKSQARPEQLVSALPSWLKGEPALH
jgi:CheY-like chemotaxis protein